MKHRRLFRNIFIFLLIFIWVFTGYPRVFVSLPIADIQFPPKIEQSKAAWVDNSWTYRRKITIGEDKVSGLANLTDFPILFYSTSTDFKASGNGGKVGKANGGDIRFTAADGTTPLDHELQTYSSTTGETIAWVEIPTLYATSSTEIYVYYGNASAEDQWDINGTWNSNYHGVWHLEEDPAVAGADETLDSTSNNNHGTDIATVAQVDAIVGKGLNLDGATGEIRVDDDDSLTFSGGMSASIWINRDSTTRTEEIFGKYDLASSAEYALAFSGNTLYWFAYDISPASYRGRTAPDSAIDTGWHNITVTYDGGLTTSSFKIYFDGVQADTGDTTSGTFGGMQNTTSYLKLGEAPAFNGANFDGRIDEMHLFATELSEGWVVTQYNTQASPSTFYTLGAEEEVPSFTQQAYRFFSNANSTDVGSPLAAQDTVATAPAQGTPFRLRMLMHMAGGDLEQNGETFKLQIAEVSGTCDTSFTGESYADVSPSSGAIRFYDNSTPTDGSALSANANDPTHSTDTIVNQTYEEQNNFTNSQAAISSGQDGKWDFSLVDNSALAGTTYCFRTVKSDGSQLDTYAVIPTITTASPTVQFTQSSSSVTEDAGSLSFQIELSGQSGQNVQVNYAVSGGTASGSGTDYTFTDGTATITAGNTTTTVSLTVTDDTLDETNETVVITLSSPTNATLGTNTTHTLTITDNDGTPSIAFTSTSSSGEESDTSVSLELSLSNVSGQNVSVSYTASGGTATGSGTDYTLEDGTATVTAGNTTTTIALTIVNDSTDESDETIEVTISSPTNASLGSNTTHTYTITDNDEAPAEEESEEEESSSSTGGTVLPPGFPGVGGSTGSLSKPKLPLGLTEGDLIRGPDNIKVYIINAFGFKRHIFNPVVFAMYGHLKWGNIKKVDEYTLNFFFTSDLYRQDGQDTIYLLEEQNEAQGKALKQPLTQEQFNQANYSPNQVFTINAEENGYYQYR